MPCNHQRHSVRYLAAAFGSAAGVADRFSDHAGRLDRPSASADRVIGHELLPGLDSIGLLLLKAAGPTTRTARRAESVGGLWAGVHPGYKFFDVRHKLTGFALRLRQALFSQFHLAI